MSESRKPIRPTTIRITPTASTLIPCASAVTPHTRIAPTAISTRETGSVMCDSCPAAAPWKPQPGYIDVLKGGARLRRSQARDGVLPAVADGVDEVGRPRPGPERPLERFAIGRSA